MRRVHVLAISVAILLAGRIALGGENPAKQPEPLPSTYALADVEFELSEGGSRGGKSIHVNGSGSGSVVERWEVKEDTKSAFSVNSGEVFQLLQLCYREGFFDLQSSYGPPNWVRLLPDGMVETMTTVVADATGPQVTVRIGGYKKSVGYLKGHGNPPPVVVELERRLNELATIGKRTDVRGGRSSNYGMNATVRPVTPLACASVAPVRPARYAVR